MRNPDNKNTERLNYRLFNNLTILVFYAAILFFIIGFNFTDVMVNGWYQQFMPSNNNRPLTDNTFLDSLTGWAVENQASDSSFILKTTNGGDNWQIIHSQLFAMTHVKFLNANTGFAGGGFLYKTTDGGINWGQLNTPASTVEKMFILNEDTIWFVNSNSATGGVFRTTNGGVNWTQQLSLGSSNPSHIYMYNARIGFIATGSGLYKTTNSGLNWFLGGGGFFSDIYFSDSLTGWKNNGNATAFQKTTDGGLNWITYSLPPEQGNILFSRIVSFSNMVKDTIWGAGGVSTSNRALIFKSTNSGMSFGYQVIDTSINIFQFQHSKFIDRLKGWEYSGFTGVHTITGGDTLTYFTGIKPISNVIPKGFRLFQNYPNPFNPVTNIKYQIVNNNSEVKLTVYDISGKALITLVDQKQNAGTYQVDFSGNNYSSGIYFYTLTADGNLIDTKKMILLK